MYLRLLLGILLIFGCANFAFASPFAYVANYNGHSVTVVDTANTANIKTVALLSTQKPYGVAVNRFGSRIYVTNQGSNDISVIDGATNNLLVSSLHTFTYEPGGLAVNPAGTRLYVAHPDQADPKAVSVLDAATGAEISSVDKTATMAGAVGVAVSPAGDLVYVTNQLDNSVSVFDSTTDTLTEVTGSPITVGAAPVGIAVNPVQINGKTFAYVANYGSGTVSVINTADNSVLTNVDLAAGALPTWLAVDPASGAQVYVADTPHNSVAVLDTATNTLEASTLSVDTGPMGIGVAVLDDGTKKFVTANNLAGTASVYTLSGTPSRTDVTAGDAPESLGNLIGPVQIPITLSVGSNGTIVPTDPISVVGGILLAAKNQNLVLNVAGNTNFAPGTVTAPGCTVAVDNSTVTCNNVTSPQTVSATFTRTGYNLVISKAGLGTGTVTSTGVTPAISCGTTCSEPYPLGTTITLTATPDPGMMFTGWSGAGCSTGDCTVTMDGGYADIYGNYAITANFAITPITTLQGYYESLAPAGGTINCAATYSETFNADQTIPVTLVPASGNTTLTGSFTISAGSITISQGADAFVIQ